MKRILGTLALACVLSGSVLAGDIHTCGLTSEEPAETAAGIIHSTDFALTVLINILSVF